MEGGERDARPSTKGARLNADGQFSRYGSEGRSSGQWEARGGEGRGHDYTNGGMDSYSAHVMGYANGSRRPQSYQPPDQRRGICRDYHSEFDCHSTPNIISDQASRQWILCPWGNVQIQPWRRCYDTGTTISNTILANVSWRDAFLIRRWLRSK